MRTVLVTGGAGFIGSAVVRHLVGSGRYRVVNVDALTYAGNLQSVAPVADSPHYAFEHVDVADADAVARVFATHRPDGVIHLAAESHVDRSIDGPDAFLRTNVVGSYTLLQAARAHVADEPARRDTFRFLHVSTDEVFGSLGPAGHFSETTPYAPTSPYSATKAASDHLARAWHHTFGLPVVTTNCSNNYGPYQFPEKLLPLMIRKTLRGEPLPVYGDGMNVRDWLYVEDHCRGLAMALVKGVPGRTYVIGGKCEMRNLDVVRALIETVREFAPGKVTRTAEELITFVKDRPGHDRRYAINPGRICRELGWEPRENFASGLRRTVQWYLDHEDWIQNIENGSYRGERLGTLS